MTIESTHLTFTTTPTIEEIARPLVASVPDRDQADARHLLVEEVLPWELRALGQHPRPTALAQAVFDGLEAELIRRSPGDRLPLLRSRVLHVRVGQAVATATDLALWRFALDHPARADAVAVRLGDRAVALLSLETVVARARALAPAVDSLEREVRAAAPRDWERDRLDLHFARLGAGSAATGSFATSAGPLADVLRELGEDPALLDVH